MKFLEALNQAVKDVIWLIPQAIIACNDFLAKWIGLLILALFLCLVVDVVRIVVG